MERKMVGEEYPDWVSWPDKKYTIRAMSAGAVEDLDTIFDGAAELHGLERQDSDGDMVAHVDVALDSVLPKCGLDCTRRAKLLGVAAEGAISFKLGMRCDRVPELEKVDYRRRENKCRETFDEAADTFRIWAGQTAIGMTIAANVLADPAPSDAEPESDVYM